MEFNISKIFGNGEEVQSFEYFNIYENIEYCLFLTLIRFFLFRLFKLLEFKWIAEDFYIFEVGERKGGEVWIFHRVKYCFTINSTRFQYLWEYRFSLSQLIRFFHFRLFKLLEFQWIADEFIFSKVEKWKKQFARGSISIFMRISIIFFPLWYDFVISFI